MPKQFSRRRYRSKKFHPYKSGTGRQYPKYRHAATAIQRMVRARQARARLAKRRKAYSIRRFNRKSAETVYKSFTIVCPDEMLIESYTSQPNQGIACANPATAEYKQQFQFGMFYRNPSTTGGIAILSPSLQNYLELYKQCRIVHGSVSLMRFSDGSGDGSTAQAAGTAPLATSSIGKQGDKDYITYMWSTIDTGSFKNCNNLTDISIPPLTNLASANPDEYLENANSRMHQISWNNRKTVKTKILNPGPKTEWAQQRVTVYDTPGTTPVLTLRTNSPWVDTNVVEACARQNYPAGHPNYQSIHSLTSLPSLSFYGSGFPTGYKSVAGVPTETQIGIHKCLISICVAFRVPTLRN